VLNRRSRLRSMEEGFTLIELLVVVAIIALLATFAAPKLFEAINKSKKAPGQADMQTISSALERYYFDNNVYPSTSAASVKTALMGGYVKANTTFKNGYGKGYIVVTNSGGGYYLFVDPRNNSGDVKVACGTGAGRWVSGSVTISTDLGYDGTVATGPTNAEVAAGCKMFAAADAAYATPLEADIVTN